MQSIKRALNFLTSKAAKSIAATDQLSSVEMDHFFGGKPAEIKPENTYWWIEDDEALQHLQAQPTTARQ